MNVVVLNGSFNKNGKTYSILNEFLNKIKHRSNNIFIVDVYDLKINHCIGCRRCEKTGECIYRDLDELYKK
ncbi:NAD(P)H-dependent oxidoreductase [Caloramator sp. mosi_1]|uniref:NAD(P)H-dependent oxidoreductase n=1 Tax=Caloramator sp. mosi_1 TaxID=3023090 RepID=UPI002361E258|nr:NAD(P)H-dependent oxidoreductase [Caloramator sp. mosi_1]WDC83523.1 NAD(P)H-dependent oxidoreductase [Caloramator sp. mosi_1]